MGSGGTSIIGRPRPLPGHRGYTRKCDEPQNGLVFDHVKSPRAGALLASGETLRNLSATEHIRIARGKMANVDGLPGTASL